MANSSSAHPHDLFYLH